jgi:hypothetical protein
MKSAVAIPVTAKCRIGIDEQDPEEALDTLTTEVKRAGVDALIVHARKAWLKGLSPRENREVPPLDYDRVYRLKISHPELEIVLNGGIETLRKIHGNCSPWIPCCLETRRPPRVRKRHCRLSFLTSNMSLAAARGCMRSLGIF